MISWLNWPSMFHLNTQNLRVKTCFKFWVLMFPSCVLGSPNRIPRCDRHCPICLWLPRSRLSRGLHIHVRQYILTISRVGTTKLLVNTSYDMNNNRGGDPILMVLHQHCFRPVVSTPSCTVMVYSGVLDSNHVGEHCFEKYASKQWSNCRRHLVGVVDLEMS